MTDTAIVAATQPQHRLTLLRPVAQAQEMLEAKREIHDLLARVLTPGVDVIEVPGTGGKDGPRLALSKAGAERVCVLFGCRVSFDIVTAEVDHNHAEVVDTPWVDSDERPSKEEADRLKAKKLGRWRKDASGSFIWMVRGEGKMEVRGLYRYAVKATITRQDGIVAGEAIGICSSLESKYCNRPRDVENTIIKMAQKRAMTSAALHAFGLSDRFTVDLEEQEPEDRTPPPQRERQQQPDPEVLPPDPAPAPPRVRSPHAAIIDWRERVRVADGGGVEMLREEIRELAKGSLKITHALELHADRRHCELTEVHHDPDARGQKALAWLDGLGGAA